MTKKPPARIDGIVAAEANVAVIFRRGPSKLTQLLVWDLNTDEVRPGQWIRGKTYTRRADVSPDGKYLVCHFTNYSAKQRGRAQDLREDWMSCGWTAVSRPPYFTAIGLWLTGGAWNGGGIWERNDRLLLNNEPHCWHESKSVRTPVRAHQLNFGGSEDEPIYSMLLKKRGWSELRHLDLENTNPGWRERGEKFFQNFRTSGFTSASLHLLMDSIPQYRVRDPGIWKKPFARGALVRVDRYKAEDWSVEDETGRVLRTWQIKDWHPQFLDVDARGRIIFGEKGCLYAWATFPNGDPQLIADLNPNVFSPVPPPAWALEW
jgi:hypothetical protein